MKLKSKSIETIKAEKIAAVDEMVEKVRHRFLTPGSAQMGVYLVKEAEAKAYLADPAIDPALIAHIVEEANETQMTVEAVAMLVMATAAEWRVISSRLEGKRMALKKMIRETDNLAALATVLNIDWDAVIEGRPS